MVAFLANGIVLLFVLAIMAVVGIFKLIGKIYDHYYWKRQAAIERAKDPEAWDKRQRETEEYIKYLDKFIKENCRG